MGGGGGVRKKQGVGANRLNGNKGESKSKNTGFDITQFC